MNRYVAFLRGINVSGHHKVPMAELRQLMEDLGFLNVVTLLNSGNIVFDSNTEKECESLEKTLSHQLEQAFTFPVPTIIRSAESISHLLRSDPFKRITVTKDIRLYVSFLRGKSKVDLKLPWSSDDNAYQILANIENTIISVLDVSITKTPKAMEALDKSFGKDITTRNWNTIKRIEQKL